MPTFEWTARFDRDFKDLSLEERKMFLEIVAEKFVAAIKNGRPYPKGLRIKGVQGAPGIWEMTWAGDGRATFEFGEQIVAGEPHIVWRRIGSHAVFNDP